MKTLFASAFALAAVLGLSQPAPAVPTEVSATQGRQIEGEDATDRVLAKIHTTNTMEINQANIALQKRQMTSVKNFAQMIVGDHTLAEQQLAALAQRLQLQVRDFTPKTKREVRDAEMDQMHLQELQQVAAEEFDRKFIEIQVDCHAKVLKWLKDKRSYVDDKEAQDFVDMQIATVSAHLMIAKDLQKSL